MYIGIDIGTSSVKTLLMDSLGEVVRTSSREYPLVFVKDGWIEQHPSDWYEKTIESLKELVVGYENKIKAISFSGQMHGLVVLDENDEVIRPAMLWCDQRTEKECEYLNNDIGKKKLISLTGNIALTGFTLPKILWMKNNELDKFNKISKIMLPKDYIAYKLSGNFATDVSDASGTLMLDVKNRKWSCEMLKIAGIDESKLPKVYESYESIGTLTKKISDELGLNENIKIVIGGGDQAIGAVGLGVVSEENLSVSLGTSGVVFSNSDEYTFDDEARVHSFCNSASKYHQMGVILSAASCLKWWVENINKTDDYKVLMEEASKSENESIYFMPYLVGERTPHNDSNIRGSFVGLSAIDTRGDMTKAVLEGVSFALRDSYEILKEMKVKGNVIRLSGGGAKNKLWREIISNVFNLKVEILNSIEGPAFGASIIAAVGDEKYDNVKMACDSLIKVTEEIFPNEEKSKKYNEKYNKFKQLYPMMCEFYK
ncbi:MAG: xylulokinase [Fusobacterium sp. JB021]|nr:xylulokinase [Fusobacterium sp. JB021]